MDSNFKILSTQGKRFSVKTKEDIELYLEGNFNQSIQYIQVIESTNNKVSIFNEIFYLLIDNLKLQPEHDKTSELLARTFRLFYQLFNENNEISILFPDYIIILNEFIPLNTGFTLTCAMIYSTISNSISLHYYRLCISTISDNTEISDLIRIYINIGISLIKIGRYNESQFYLNRAFKIRPDDPDVALHIGINHIELNEPDLVSHYIQICIDNANNSVIGTTKEKLLSLAYLNLSHMNEKNGNFKLSGEQLIIASINNSDLISHALAMVYKTYNIDEFDTMDIVNEHFIHNSFYDSIRRNFNYNYNWNTEFINIGFISGDFINHPVEYFISTFLNNFDNKKFNVICYSQTPLLVQKIGNASVKNIQGFDEKRLSDLINSDNIHILFDLSGHTAHNRLDVFANKPSPIQITYIGYPFTTGLKEMDYRFSDLICEIDPIISQKYHSEKLILIPNCFTCYNPINKYPDINNSDGNYFNIGCFNRLNKVTDRVKSLFNKILLLNPKVQFLFKNKSFRDSDLFETFKESFDLSVRSRIISLKFTETTIEHLSTYNMVDITIDSFPYSGTTTSCESLLMGVPVLTIYDTKNALHITNVTTSLLKNSDLDFYVCDSEKQLIEKIDYLSENKINKEEVRSKFLNGYVCNKTVYMINIQKIISDLYDKHRSI
jgi:protein O-GlcNAc transferase